MKSWADTWINTDVPNKSGGQGTIYFVRRKGSPTETFVLKEIINGKRLNRFKMEIEIIKKLPIHPNVVRIIDSGCIPEKNKLFYVMPKADINLHEAVIAKNIPLKDLISIFVGILAGVSHIHKNNVLHRDVKPENILLINKTPLIADFGLSISIVEEDRNTPSWEVVGPRNYLAPEFEDGRLENLSLKSDIYSLGKVLYFILSQGRMFSREKYRDKQNSLSLLHRDARYAIFDNIFEHTINKNINDRYQSIEILQKEFERAVNEFDSHPLSKVEKRIPLDTLCMDPARIENYILSIEEKDKIIEYFDKNEKILKSSTLIYLMRDTEGVNPFKSGMIVSNSINKFSEFEKIEFLDFIGESENLCRSVLMLTTSSFFKKLILPSIEAVRIQSLEMVVDVAGLQMQNIPEIVEKLFLRYKEFSPNAKKDYLNILANAGLQFGAEYSKSALQEYNPESDTPDQTIYEALIFCCLVYFDEEDFKQLLLSKFQARLNNDDCILKSFTKALMSNGSKVKFHDLTSITNPILVELIEIDRSIRNNTENSD